jgi:hypothetical protein
MRVGVVYYNCIAGYALSWHSVRNIFGNHEWYMEWLGMVHRRYPAYHSDLRTSPPPPFCGNLPPRWDMIGYGNGGQTIWPYGLSNWPRGRRTVKRYPVASIFELWFFSNCSEKQLWGWFCLETKNSYLLISYLPYNTSDNVPTVHSQPALAEIYTFLFTLRKIFSPYIWATPFSVL